MFGSEERVGSSPTCLIHIALFPSRVQSMARHSPRAVAARG